MQQEKLLRGLGLRDSIAIVVGTIIGTGIFLKTAIMTVQVGSPGLVLLAWAIAGLLSLAGALAYAELGELFPKAGGEFVYLREAYGEMPAFLYGWQRFWIGSPGSIAAYAAGSATFLSGLVHLDAFGGMVPVSVAFILLFTSLNCLAVSFGGRVQSFMTGLKLLMVLGLCAGILLFSKDASWAHLGQHSGIAFSWSAFGAAVIAALWAFDGWNNLPMAAGEVENPSRNIPVALVAGTILVFLLYALANISYFYALPLPEVLSAYSSRSPDALPVATKAAQSFLGTGGLAILSFAFVFSALGAMNGSILTSARVPFAMAEASLFPKFLAKVSAASRVPVTAVIVQGLWACVLVSSGSFDQLTDYVVFASWIFYAMNAYAVLRLRRKMPHQARRYKVRPWVPLLFCLVAMLLLANTLISAPKESGIGLLFIAAGVPFYFYFHKNRR